jgi:hypothetical protein
MPPARCEALHSMLMARYGTPHLDRSSWGIVSLRLARSFFFEGYGARVGHFSPARHTASATANTRSSCSPTAVA